MSPLSTSSQQCTPASYLVLDQGVRDNLVTGFPPLIVYVVLSIVAIPLKACESLAGPFVIPVGIQQQPSP